MVFGANKGWAVVVMGVAMMAAGSSGMAADAAQVTAAAHSSHTNVPNV
ncbi:exported hypothetical protein [Azospirillaceae bacterium]